MEVSQSMRRLNGIDVRLTEHGHNFLAKYLCDPIVLLASPDSGNADWAVEDEISPAYIKNKSLVEDKIEEIEQTSVPSGVITLWYGLSDTVPDGWAICDGSNGT